MQFIFTLLGIAAGYFVAGKASAIPKASARWMLYVFAAITVWGISAVVLVGVLGYHANSLGVGFLLGLIFGSFYAAKKRKSQEPKTTFLDRQMAKEAERRKALGYDK